MASRKAGKTHEEARDQSRTALTKAATAMLLEEAQRNPFAGMRVRDLCERAGYSTGTFYARWPDAETFYIELASQLLDSVIEEDFDELQGVAREAAKLTGAEAIMRLATADLSILLENDHWDAVELLNVTWARTRLREPAARGFRSIDELTADTYLIVLDEMGREPRPPLEAHHIGVVLQALVEGFGLRAKIDAAGIESPNASSPSLYPLAVASVLAMLTRPRQEDRSLTQALDDEFGTNRGTT